MFGNFIYFIIVLLIYLTHQPAEEANVSGAEALTLFLLLIFIFAAFTRLQFQRIEKGLATENFSTLDHRFNATLTRQSVLAILVFAIDIYGLNISAYPNGLVLFSRLPTLQTIVFVGLFAFYLAIVWYCAHSPYQKLYRADISRRSYVLSNISFGIPVLLPWIVLSGVADIINFLPFEWPRRILATTEGEIIYFLFFLVAVTVIGPVIIQKFWRCKPLENGFHRSRIELLCQRAAMSYADILHWPIFGGKMITAGVMGLVGKFRYILVTRSLLKMLDPEEIDAVIAHEIGHIKRKHLLFYLIFFVGYMLVSYITFDFIIFTLVYAKPVAWFINSTGISHSTVVSALFGSIIIVIFLIYFRFFFGFFMRNFERQADLFVYSLFDDAKPLISTLKKIAVASGQPADRPNWHHFSIQERIAYLKKCETDPDWIRRHERKVKKSIAVYLVGLFSIAALGYYLNVGALGTTINNRLIEQILLKELEKTPDNANLYGLLGDLYYIRNDLEGVRDAYEKSLALGPDNAQILNNLAWLYATSANERLRNPERALELATKAAALENSAHILDTLAESYFVNGMAAEAIHAAERALTLAKSNRSYYQEQLAKFKKAAEN